MNSEKLKKKYMTDQKLNFEFEYKDPQELILNPLYNNLTF